MSDAQLTQLRAHLEVIHDHFERLYNPAPRRTVRHGDRVQDHQ